MYGMKRTTVYLPDELKAAVERAAAADRRSEAEIIREALRAAMAQRLPASPRIPLGPFTLGNPTAAEGVDNLLDGFGRQ